MIPKKIILKQPSCKPQMSCAKKSEEEHKSPQLGYM